MRDVHKGGGHDPTGKAPEPRMLRRKHKDIVAPSGRRVVETVDRGLQPLAEDQIQRRGDNQINPTTDTVRRRLWVNANCKGRRDVKMGTHGKCMVR